MDREHSQKLAIQENPPKRRHMAENLHNLLASGPFQAVLFPNAGYESKKNQISQFNNEFLTIFLNLYIRRLVMLLILME